jgi:phosphate/sulfate permease
VGYQVGEEDQSPTMAAETGMRTPPGTEAARFAAVSEMCGALLGSEVLD